MTGVIEMNLKQLVKNIFYPSVNQTLKTFRKKSNLLKKRIVLNAAHINSNDAIIAHLEVSNMLLNQEIKKAKNAVESLEKITG
jgi:hypothetical protein